MSEIVVLHGIRVTFDIFQRHNMKEIQKYIWLLLVMAVIAKTFPFIKDIYLSQTYGTSEAPSLVKRTLEIFSFGLVAMQNIASSLWLRHLAIKNKLSIALWSIFGLFFGLIAVAIFYIAKINERQET